MILFEVIFLIPSDNNMNPSGKKNRHKKGQIIFTQRPTPAWKKNSLITIYIQIFAAEFYVIS